MTMEHDKVSGRMCKECPEIISLRPSIMCGAIVGSVSCLGNVRLILEKGHFTTLCMFLMRFLTSISTNSRKEYSQLPRAKGQFAYGP